VIAVSRSRGGDCIVTIAQGLVLDRALGLDRLPAERLFARIQVELGPLRPGERPLLLLTRDEPVDVADLEQDPRLPLPAIVDVLEEVVEETLLEVSSVVGVEMGPVLQAVDLQPFLLAGGADEALDIAAKMEAVAAPVARREHRHRDFLPDGGAFPVKRIVERVGQRVSHHVRPVLGQLRLGQRVGARDQQPAVGVDRTALAQSVLHRHHLYLEPVAPEVG
jgi:hypothetical protein